MVSLRLNFFISFGKYIGFAGSRVATRIASRSGRTTVTCRLDDFLAFTSGLLEFGLTSEAVSAQLAPFDEAEVRLLPEEPLRLDERRFFDEDADFRAEVVVAAFDEVFFLAASAHWGTAKVIRMTEMTIQTKAREERCECVLLYINVDSVISNVRNVLKGPYKRNEEMGNLLPGTFLSGTDADTSFLDLRIFYA